MARVLIVNLDAANPPLLEAWCEAGELPVLASFRRDALTYDVANRVGLVPDSIWPEVNTGRSVARTGHCNPLMQFTDGASRARRIRPGEFATRPTYWLAADRAGRDVRLVDVPESHPCEGFRGYHLQHYGLHYCVAEPASQPPEAMAEARARHGVYPMLDSDEYFYRPAGLPGLERDLLAGIGCKLGVALDQVRQPGWDLCVVTFSEAHSAGHHFWHFHDPTYPQHPPECTAEERDRLLRIYRRLDEALGTLLEAAGPETMVWLFASHGMGPLGGAQDMLSELLVGLGIGPAGGWRLRAAVRLPRWVKRGVRRWVGNAPVDALRLGFKTRLETFDGARAIAVQNYHVGAVRLNLIGREREGVVAPGGEAEALLSEIELALVELRDVRTGEPILERAVRVDEAFGPGRHPDMPDLLVRMRRDLGRIERCRSDRVGELCRPELDRRTGEHTEDSRLWIRGPRCYEANPVLRPADALDLAPTVLRLLDLEPSSEHDGALLSGLFD